MASNVNGRLDQDQSPAGEAACRGGAGRSGRLQIPVPTLPPLHCSGSSRLRWSPSEAAIIFPRPPLTHARAWRCRGAVGPAGRRGGGAAPACWRRGKRLRNGALLVYFPHRLALRGLMFLFVSYPVYRGSEISPHCTFLFFTRALFCNVVLVAPRSAAAARLQGSRAPGLQGSRAPGLQGSRVPGLQGSRTPGLQGSRAPGLQGAMLQDSRTSGSGLAGTRADKSNGGQQDHRCYLDTGGVGRAGDGGWGGEGGISTRTREAATIFGCSRAEAYT